MRRVFEAHTPLCRGERRGAAGSQGHAAVRFTGFTTMKNERFFYTHFIHICNVLSLFMLFFFSFFFQGWAVLHASVTVSFCPLRSELGWKHANFGERDEQGPRQPGMNSFPLTSLHVLSFWGCWDGLLLVRGPLQWHAPAARGVNNSGPSSATWQRRCNWVHLLKYSAEAQFWGHLSIFPFSATLYFYSTTFIDNFSYLLTFLSIGNKLNK